MGTSHFSGWMDELVIESVTLESFQTTFLKPMHICFLLNFTSVIFVYDVSTTINYGFHVLKIERFIEIVTHKQTT